jgi:hypothetical protein
MGGNESIDMDYRPVFSRCDGLIEVKSVDESLLFPTLIIRYAIPSAAQIAIIIP